MRPPSPTPALARRAARPRGLALVSALAGLGAACSGPSAPSFPSPEETAPPRAAAELCEPPYPPFVAGDYRLVDLDQSSACVAYVERDECIVSLFRDCTLSTADREWQGRITASDDLSLSAFYVGSRVPPPRSPKCCRGRFEDALTAEPWARLVCSTAECSKGEAPDHLGFYLERLVEDEPFVDLPSRVNLSISSKPIIGVVVAHNTSDQDVLLSITEGGVLFAVTLDEETPTDVRALPVGSVSFLSVTDDGSTAIAAGPRSVYRIGLHAIPEIETEIDVAGDIQGLAIAEDLVLLALRESSGHRISARALTALGTEVLGIALESPPSGILGLGGPRWVGLVRFSSSANNDGDVFLVFGRDGETHTVEATTTVTSEAHVAPSVVAYTGPCDDAVPGPHCYFEFDPESGAEPKRLVPPSMGSVRAISPVASPSTALSPGAEARYVALASGQSIACIDRTRWRPWMSRYASLSHEVQEMTASHRTNRLYVLPSGAGTIEIFEASARLP